MLNKSFVNRLKESIRGDGPWILLFSLLAIPVLVTPFIARFPGGEKKLQVLHQMAAETPLHPDFKEIDSSTMIKEHSVLLTYFYNVPAYSTTFNMVKNYYTLALTPKGWRLDKEDNYGVNEGGVIFRKDEYAISIYNYPGRTRGWDYSISYSWKEP